MNNNYEYEERLNSEIHKYFSPNTDAESADDDGGLSFKNGAGSSFNKIANGQMVPDPYNNYNYDRPPVPTFNQVP
jgi:hypothetical protein